jgi:hypothetical protein
MNSRSVSDSPPAVSTQPRIFVREPGWRLGLKSGSAREFCYQVAPGEDFYHRLADGEVFVHRGDERLCLSCADRRGILDFEPRRLRDPREVIEIEDTAETEEYPVRA